MPKQKVERKITRVVMALTTGAILEGKVYLGTSIYDNRISDMLKKEDEEFITLVDVTTSTKEISEGATVFINKDRIVWVTPVND